MAATFAPALVSTISTPNVFKADTLNVTRRCHRVIQHFDQLRFTHTDGAKVPMRARGPPNTRDARKYSSLNIACSSPGGPGSTKMCAPSCWT
jgi:hypothetical protein